MTKATFVAAIGLLVSGGGAFAADIVDHGDGSYHLTLDPGESTADYWDGVIEWTYDGQETFWFVRPAWQTMAVDDDGIDPGTTDGGIADLWDSIRIDDLGRRWTVRDVDLTGLAVVLATYDDDVGEEEQASEDPAFGQAFTGTWTPETWSEGCVVVPNPGTQVFWNTDDRALFFSPPSTRQDKSVSIGPDDSMSTATNGSGVLVQPDRVLTVAHNLIAPGGAQVPPPDLLVCTRGNAQAGTDCSRVRGYTIHRRALTIATGLQPLDPFPMDFTRRDVAVVQLRDPLPGGNMLLSRASGSTIAANPAFLAGYPGTQPGPSCSNNRPTPYLPSVGWARDGYWTSGAVTQTGRSLLRTTLDAGLGMSGSPVYYYPEGCCGRHLLTAVHSSFLKAGGVLDNNAFHAETRIKPVRSWVIGLMGLEP